MSRHWWLARYRVGSMEGARLRTAAFSRRDSPPPFDDDQPQVRPAPHDLEYSRFIRSTSCKNERRAVASGESLGYVSDWSVGVENLCAP